MDDDDLGKLCIDHLAPIIPDAAKRYEGCRVVRTPIAYPVFATSTRHDRAALEASTGVDRLLSIGRNGEFAHILMEDVYWRTRRRLMRSSNSWGVSDHVRSDAHAQPEADARTQPWWARWPVLFAAALVEAVVLVPWRYLASEDGPTNLASARIIANYPGAYGTYFTLDWLPKFNTLWQLVLIVPTSIMAPVVAERLLLVALVVALPLAGWYAVTGIRRDSGPLAFFLLPLSIGYFFHAGYYGFCLSLVLGVVTVGWWLRHRDLRASSWVVFAGLLVLTYLAHIVTAGMVVVVLSVVTGWEFVTDDRQRSRQRLIRTVSAAVPFVVLYVVYAARRGQGREESGSSHLFG